MKFGLPSSTIHKITETLHRYSQVNQAILYGSRAKGNYKNGSDIDLTLIGGDELTLDVLLKISEDLDDQLLPYKIDLSIFHEIENPEIIKHIHRVGVRFYENPEAILNSNDFSLHGDD